MDDAAPLDAPRRTRIAPLAIVVVLAFAIGVTLMWLATREGWLAEEPAPVAAVRAAAPPAASIAPTPAAVAMAPLTLETREVALAARLAALEARAAAISVDIATSADRAGRAEAILVAFAARRAIERGMQLGYLEEQLRARFGLTQQRAVVTIIQAGRDPVTIEALRQALDANAVLLLNPGASGWFDGLLQELRSLIVLHEANTPSPLPADRLSRARRMLDEGQVEPAIEEIGRLPGAAQAAKWTAAARRYVDARRALDTLETAAIVGTLPTATVQAPAVELPQQPGLEAAPEATTAPPENGAQ